jgi:hypothetical protein
MQTKEEPGEALGGRIDGALPSTQTRATRRRFERLRNVMGDEQALAIVRQAEVRRPRGAMKVAHGTNGSVKGVIA